MAFKLLHLADLHLDATFRGSSLAPNLSHSRREGLRDILKSAFSLAREKQVDAVTIGGDLFEAETVTADTAEFLRQQFAQLNPTRIFISPGNHDPYTTNSIYARATWSANVHIFREPRLTMIPLDSELDLWSAAHDSPSFYEPLVASFHLPGTKPAVLLLHGTDSSLTLGKDKGTFCPFTQHDVVQAGFSLALLGHIHHLRFTPETYPLLCYPGSPEPLGFDEPTGHSVLLAEWDGKKWKVEAIDQSRWMYRIVELDISDFGSRDEIAYSIREMWQTERQSRKVMLRVLLTGIPQASLDLDVNAIRASVGDIFAMLELDDQTLAPLDFDALKQDPTTTGVFVRKILAEIEAAKGSNNLEMQERLGRALRFGLLALQGREIPLP